MNFIDSEGPSTDRRTSGAHRGSCNAEPVGSVAHARIERVYCGECRRSKPADAFHLDRSRWTGRAYRCKECVREYQRVWRERNGGAIRKRRVKRYKEQMKDPAKRAARRKYEREYKRAHAEKERKYKREYDRKVYAERRANPEAWAAFLEKKRIEYAASMEDREAHAARLEARRMHRRMKRIEAGLPVRELKNRPQEPRVKLDTAPLISWLNLALQDALDNLTDEGAYALSLRGQAPGAGELAKVIGVDEKIIREIVTEKRTTIALDTADRIVTGIGLTLDLVYEGEEER